MTQMKCAKRKKPTKRTKDYPRSVPLKKRPVDASLFSMTKSRSNSNVSNMSADWEDQLQQQQHQHKQHQIMSMMQQHQNHQQQHQNHQQQHHQQHQQHHQQQQQQSMTIQQGTSDPTTESIVSAAVKALLQSNQARPQSPSRSIQQQQHHQSVSQLGFPNFNGTNNNPLDLLQVLHVARTLPLSSGVNPSNTMTALRMQHFMQHQHQQQPYQQPLQQQQQEQHQQGQQRQQQHLQQHPQKNPQQHQHLQQQQQGNLR